MVKKIREPQIMVKLKDRTKDIPLAQKQVIRPKKDFSSCKPVEFRLTHWFKTPKEKKSKYFETNMMKRNEAEKRRKHKNPMERFVSFVKARLNSGEEKLNRALGVDDLKLLEKESDE